MDFIAVEPHLVDPGPHDLVDERVVDRARKPLPGQVIGDDLELFLDDPIHDDVDGVGVARGLRVAEVR